LKKLEKEIRDLKQELAMHDTLAQKGKVNYDPYTPEQ
jgi:kinesin family protein 6/9